MHEQRIIFKDFFMFRHRGREGEREGEKHQSVASPMAGTHNPGMWPEGKSNQPPFPSQDDTQPTEPHQ